MDLESGHAEFRHAVGCLCEQPLCLLEAAEHRQEAIAARQYGTPLDLRVLVEPAQALLDRRRAQKLMDDQLTLRPLAHCGVVRPSRVLDQPLGSVHGGSP